MNMHSDRKLRNNLIAAALSLIGLLWFYGLSSYISTPDVALLRWHIPSKTAYMKHSDKPPVHKYVSLKKISPYLRQAVVLAEDDRFFEHNGVDWDAAKKAAEKNWKRKRFSHGASTIPMQLARNLYLSPGKTPFRKLREILISMKIERWLSKERILEIYLNVAEWGDGIYGAEAAAEHYFKGSAAALGKHEAAYLAAILPRPVFYDRRGGGSYLSRRINSIEGRL